MIRSIIGGAAIAVGGLLAGVSAAKESRAAAARILEVRGAAAVMRREICDRLATVTEAVKTARSEFPECRLLSSFESGISKQGACSIPACWKKSVGDSGVSVEAEGILARLTPVLGRYGSAEQRAVFDEVTASLDALYLEARERNGSLCKIYTIMGACGGAALAIMLM